MKRIIKDLKKLDKVASVFVISKDGDTNKAEAKEIITEIRAVMEKKPELVALSAPQIGIDSRIFCIRFNDTIKAFVNPIITKKKGIEYSIESLPNIPDIEYFISRPNEITVIYHTEDLKYEENKLLSPASKIFEQQCQILDGVLPNVYGMEFPIEEGLSLKEAPEEVISTIANIYTEWSKKHAEELKNSIAEDKELETAYKKLKFTEDVINGRTQVITDDENKEKQEKNPAINLAVDKIKKANYRSQTAAFVNRKSSHKKGKK